MALHSLVSTEASKARPGHLDGRVHRVLGTERVLDGAQQVVRFEDQDHLAVDGGQHVGDLAEVELNVGLDLAALKERQVL